LNLCHDIFYQLEKIHAISQSKLWGIRGQIFGGLLAVVGGAAASSRLPGAGVFIMNQGLKAISEGITDVIFEIVGQGKE